MGRASWAAAHTRSERCPKPSSYYGVWGRWPQEESGARGATPLGDLPSPADPSSAVAKLRRVEAGFAPAGRSALWRAGAKAGAESLS